MSDQKKVVVIDDDPEMVRMLKTVLETASYNVLTASNGAEGLRLVRTATPDAVVLDLMMPEKDGFAVCHDIKTDPALARIPVLVLTGIGQKLTHTRYAKAMGLTLESEDYVEKPIDSSVLLQRLAVLLR